MANDNSDDCLALDLTCSLSLEESLESLNLDIDSDYNCDGNAGDLTTVEVQGLRPLLVYQTLNFLLHYCLLFTNTA